MDILKRSSKTWVSEVLSNLDTMWDTIESTISKSGSASYLVPLQQFIFKFLVKSLIGADPSSSKEISESGYIMLDRWLALQILPTVHIGALQPLVEIFLHSWAYPSFLVSGDYNKLYQFVEKEGNLPNHASFIFFSSVFLDYKGNRKGKIHKLSLKLELMTKLPKLFKYIQFAP